MNSLIIATNNIRRLFREIHSIVFLLILPILGGLWTISLVSFYDVTKLGINMDLPSSHKLHEIISQTGKFSLNYYKEDEILKKIKNKELDIGIIMPENYEKLILVNNKVNVKILSLENNSNVIQVRAIVEEYMQASYWKKPTSGNQFLINAKNNIPGQRSTMGFMLMFILLFTGTGMELILEDKKCKTYMRIFYSPVKTHEFILGNLISNISLGTIQIVLFLFFTKYILRFDWKTPLINVFLILITFLICAMGISIGLIGFIRNHRIYSVSNAMLSLFTCFIGGAFFSSSLMGATLDKIAYFLPQKWAMQTYEKLVEGIPLSDIGMNFWVLLLFGMVFASFGIKALYPTEEEL